MSERGQPEHPLVDAVRPLVEALRAAILPPCHGEERDIPLRWEGETVAYVRLPSADGLTGLSALIDEVERELGSPLADLSRGQKQRAVRLLEERGAFEWRRSVETVAQSIGVSRFTVYNYLNRESGGR